MWSKRINGEDPAETFPAIPDLVVVFGPTDRLADRGLTDRLMSSCGDAIVIGCSSGTMVDGDGLDDDAVVLLGMGFERTKLALAVQPRLRRMVRLQRARPSAWTWPTIACPRYSCCPTG